MLDRQVAASKTLATAQFLWKATEVATDLMLCALGRGPSVATKAPAPEMTSLRKKEIAFLDKALDHLLGETKKGPGSSRNGTSSL